MLQTDSGEYVPVWDKLQVSCDTFHMLEKSDVRDLCVVCRICTNENYFWKSEKYICCNGGSVAVRELDPER